MQTDLNFLRMLHKAGWTPCPKDKPGAQWLPQDYGCQTYGPQDDMSLKELLELIGSEVAQKASARILDLEGLIGSPIVDTDENDKLKATVAALEAKVKELESTRLVDQPENFHCQPDKVTSIERNGVTPPRSGATARIWEVANGLRAAGSPHCRADVVAAVKLAHPEIKETTAASCYSNWCRYHGIDPKNPSKPFVGKEVKESRDLAQPAQLPPVTTCLHDVPHAYACAVCDSPSQEEIIEEAQSHASQCPSVHKLETSGPYGCDTLCCQLDNGHSGEHKNQFATWPQLPVATLPEALLMDSAKTVVYTAPPGSTYIAVDPITEEVIWQLPPPTPVYLPPPPPPPYVAS